MKLHNTSRSLAKRWLLQTNHFSSVSFVEGKRKNPQSQRPCGFMVAGARFELTTFGLWAQRATGLLHPAIYWFLKEDSERYANMMCCNVNMKNEFYPSIVGLWARRATGLLHPALLTLLSALLLYSACYKKSSFFWKKAKEFFRQAYSRRKTLAHPEQYEV